MLAWASGCEVLLSLAPILERAYKGGILGRRGTGVMSGPWATHSVASNVGDRRKYESVRG